MNLFELVDCINLKDDKSQYPHEEIRKTYNGPIIVLESIQFPSLFVFFPVTKKHMELIHQAMFEETDTKELAIYNTMIDSWKGSNSYLSGIVMDLIFEPSDPEPRIITNFALADDRGDLTSLIPVTFVDSIIISILLEQNFLLTNKLLSHILPENPENKNRCCLEDDKRIKNIVKGILDGKIKDKDGDPSKDSKEK